MLILSCREVYSHILSYMSLGIYSLGLDVAQFCILHLPSTICNNTAAIIPLPSTIFNP
jgi:hypothetical protein